MFSPRDGGVREGERGGSKRWRWRSLAEKATPRRVDLTVESYLAYTGFPETGRRYIFPEIGTRWDGWQLRADAIEKLPSLVVTPVHSQLRMQEQANQTDDVWSTCSGPSTGPRGGAEPSRFRGPQGSAPAAQCGVRPSVCRLNRKNDFCPRAHYCLPLLLLLCASCIAAFWSTECNDEESLGRPPFYFCRRNAWATLNIQAKDRIVWWVNNEISSGNERGIIASDFSTIIAAASIPSSIFIVICCIIALNFWLLCFVWCIIYKSLNLSIIYHAYTLYSHTSDYF